ncbi:MAG: preprotein translocase subunit SecG [Cyclobacteriaceae bacterium]|nr:preprotein translocase subunit SecG [Cyclobacteriaceae bacterium]MCH8516111.1 preprotein translocase subunit SecG [Cyclobacteriaceae bacterium]
MFTIIISIIIVLSVILVLIILAQNSKGGGLSSQFGGSSTSQVIGVKRTTDLMEKLTWGFGIAVVVLSMGTNKLLDKDEASMLKSPNIDRAQEQQITPSFGGSGGQEGAEEITIDDESSSEDLFEESEEN